MKRFISLLVLTLVATPVVAAPGGGGRRTMSSQMMAAPRASSVRYQPAPTSNNSVEVSAAQSSDTSSMSSIRGDMLPDISVSTKPGDNNGGNGGDDKPSVDMREKEKKACLANNIGVGNTFVWASRYSNVNNYSSMVEDVENPENNVCFVKVEVKSNDSKISVSDVPFQYYEMGRNITCGAWADEAKLRDRILAAKKKARTWATVGGGVGGAGLGVGLMELAGNRLIGGAVEGQKALEGEELLRSQLLVLKKEHQVEFEDFMDNLDTLVKACDAWDADAEKPEECEDWVKYRGLLSIDLP